MGQADSQVAFLARGRHLSTYLTRSGIEVEPYGGTTTGRTHQRIRIEITNAASVSPSISFPIRGPTLNNNVAWKGVEPIRAESNYFIGGNPAHWHTHVPHFTRAKARGVLPGVDVVAHAGSDGSGGDMEARDDRLEFDLHVAPAVDASHLRLRISGANGLRLNSEGDLVMLLDGDQVRMHKPALYEEIAWRELARNGDASMTSSKRSPIEGGYLLEADGSVGFRIGTRNPHAALVIDPSLSVAYSTFLGGVGEDVANSIALDSAGKLYVGGTTTSAPMFSEAVTKQEGPGGGSTDFFIAKIDPSATGASSLVYLTFLGGSGTESGGLVAVNKSGNLAITGTTTSPDFPVTDGSKLTSGSNDVAVAELGPGGDTLVYATIFGGSGAESTQNPGGIALFLLAVFRPTVTPHLEYCTYLGINA